MIDYFVFCCKFLLEAELREYKDCSRERFEKRIVKALRRESLAELWFTRVECYAGIEDRVAIGDVEHPVCSITVRRW